MRDLKSKPNGLRLRRLSLMLAAFSCALACDDEPLELTKGDTEVVVPERYRECSADDDCTLANISCDGCCDRDAVAKSLAKAFERDRKGSCSGYDGPECDCAFAELEARCKEERCVAVPVPVQ
jgi:hypothetical protein